MTLFQAAMTQVAENQNTSAMNDDELTRVFNEIDDDGNGYITPREAKKAFRKLADKFNISRVRLILEFIDTKSVFRLNFFPNWEVALDI